MAKNKLKKFAEVATFSNVIQTEIEEVFRIDHPIKGNWHSQFFKNNNPIVLELGCGKGEYTTGLATRYPEKNIIGIDIKGARIWRGASDALQNGLLNAGFLRTRIEHISSVFAKNEVSEIWITFPDPQEKRDRSTKRLTSSLFLPLYKQFLKPNGVIHLKTDNEILYNYTSRLCLFNKLDVQYQTNDLYNSGLNDEPLLLIKTHYEALFTSKGLSIKYIRFTIDNHDTFIEPPNKIG